MSKALKLHHLWEMFAASIVSSTLPKHAIISPNTNYDQASANCDPSYTSGHRLLGSTVYWMTIVLTTSSLGVFAADVSSQPRAELDCRFVVQDDPANS